MTVTQRILDPERLRQVPAPFSWIDHRRVREHYFEKADVCAWTLYLFLLCVADAHGLSDSAEATLSRRLRLPLTRLAQARRDRLALELLADDPPLYQVLSRPQAVPVTVRLGQLRAGLEGRS